MSHEPIIHVPTAESGNPPPAIRRCAIYARVSVSSQDSNTQLTSLQAQVQACESFIQSQRSMGWELVAPPYIDDGYSGGTLDRPALIELTQDVEAGKFDAVIVQRLDRLCRSVGDICDLLPLFSITKTSLVSLAQAFDSETPTGRLTLHLLSTFGQFERELAGERVRDKFAITRASGRWQRSGIPLGYTLTDQQELQVNATEAAVVRDIFQRFLAVDSMTQLVEELSILDYRTKSHTSRNGNQHGGNHFDRNTLNQLLRNRAYIGEVFYKDAWHPGKHEPIIDRALWDQVQAIRSQRARRTGIPTAIRQVEHFPLAGLVFWHDGSAYTLYESSNRKELRYRYYTAPKITSAQTDGPGPVTLPTHELHQVVIHHLRERFKDPQSWLDGLPDEWKSWPEFDPEHVKTSLSKLDQTWRHFIPQMVADVIRQLVNRVTIYPEQVQISVNASALSMLLKGFMHSSSVPKKAPKPRRRTPNSIASVTEHPAPLPPKD
ncbi:MAG: recombinase family protein [Limnohabitans sp.]